MHEVRQLVAEGRKNEIVVAKKTSSRAASAKGHGLAAIAIPREEARKTNQRRDDRHLNLIDTAVIIFRRKRFEVPVLNVSAHGVMIEADVEARVAERIEIRFEDCNRTQCFVRWVKGRQIGLEFVEESVLIAPADIRQRIISGRRAGEEPAKLAMKAGRPPRHKLILKGILHCGIESFEVRIRNISTEGVMLDCSEDLLAGSPVVIEVTGGGALALEGQVRWCRAGQIGIVFADAFDMAILADGNSGREPPVQAASYVKPEYLATEGSADSPWAARTYGLRTQDL